MPISPWGITNNIPCITKSTHNDMRARFADSSKMSHKELRNEVHRLKIYLGNCIDIRMLRKLENEDSN
jgi:hypothetical protein